MDLERLIKAFLYGKINKDFEYEYDDGKGGTNDPRVRVAGPPSPLDKFLKGRIEDGRYVYDDGTGGQDYIPTIVDPPGPSAVVDVAGPPGLIDKFLRGRIEGGQYVYDDGTGGQDYVPTPAPTPRSLGRGRYGELRSPYEEQQLPTDQEFAADRAALLEAMGVGGPVSPITRDGIGGPPAIDPERLVEQLIEPPTAPPSQNSWEQFVAMNPNLDYDAVARQAGGVPGSFPVENEFGGAISEMPESAKQKEQVQALLDYVKNEIPREEIARKQDPRSRAYDPQGAEQMIQQIKQDQEAEAMAAETRIREITANAAMKNAEAYETLANQGKTAGGYQFGGGSGAPSPSAMNTRVGMLVEEMQNRMVGDGVEGGAEINNAIAADISRMKMLAGLGRYEEALVIAEKYLGNNPDNAPAPAGAAALAKKEGTSVVTPTGSKYKTDADGNLVYVG